MPPCSIWLGFDKNEICRTGACFPDDTGARTGRVCKIRWLHRNTFIRSPILLDEQLRLKTRPHIRFAGQITGVEGYVESAATGLMAGRMAAANAYNSIFTLPPVEQLMVLC